MPRGPSRTKLLLMLGAVAAAVLFAVLLLAGGKNTLIVEFNVGGVQGTLVPVSDDGSLDSSRSISFELEAGQKRLRRDDLDPGMWEVTAKRPGYSEKVVRVDHEAGGSSAVVELRAMSRKVTVATNVVGATVSLETGDGGTDEEVYDGTGPVTFVRNPGSFVLAVEHRGYVRRSEKIALTAEEDLELTWNLDEFVGWITLTEAVPGSKVEVQDEEDYTVVKRDVVGEDGTLRLELRDGTYLITLVADRYEDEPIPAVTVEGGKDAAPRQVKQSLKKGRLVVTVKLEPDSDIKEVAVYKRGVFQNSRTLKATGADGSAQVTFHLDEGDYEVRVGETRKSCRVEAGKTAPVAIP